MTQSLLTPSGRDRAKIKAYNDRRIISQIGACSVCGIEGVKIWMQGGRRCVSCHNSWKRVKKGLPAIPLTPLESDIDNFWKRVEKLDSETECWIWKGGFTEDGYGRMYSRYFQDSHLRAHRFSFYLTHGRFPQPNGLHKCDNPKCVNPSHVFEGTPLDNIRDCIAKGRFKNGVTFGIANHKSKLDPDKVIQIREQFSKGASLSHLGRIFGVSAQSIRQVVLRQSWGHVVELSAVSELKRAGKIHKVGTRPTKSGCSAAIYKTTT